MSGKVKGRPKEEIMNKNEFLDTLRKSLEGEVDNAIIEKNIRYYSEYISSGKGKSEEEIIEEIGDPRLIAKTIIETEKISGRNESGRDYYSGRYDSDNRNKRYGEDNENTGYGSYKNTKHKDITKFKWVYKVLFWVVLALILIILINIGLVFIKLLSVFFVPILLIALIIYVLRKR